MAGFLRTGNSYDRQGILVRTITPYPDDDDDYGHKLVKLSAALRTLQRHIEINMATLDHFALGPNGREIDPTDPGPARIYLHYEVKRLVVLRLLNSALTECSLPGLP